VRRALISFEQLEDAGIITKIDVRQAPQELIRP
jgi:hypothetical protein